MPNKRMSDKKIFDVIVVPNSKKSRIAGFNKKKNAYVIDIKEPAENGKANKALLRLIEKEMNRKAKIILGKTQKKKTIRLE